MERKELSFTLHQRSIETASRGGLAVSCIAVLNESDKLEFIRSITFISRAALYSSSEAAFARRRVIDPRAQTAGHLHAMFFGSRFRASKAAQSRRGKSKIVISPGPPPYPETSERRLHSGAAPVAQGCFEIPLLAEATHRKVAASSFLRSSCSRTGWRERGFVCTQTNPPNSRLIEQTKQIPAPSGGRVHCVHCWIRCSLTTFPPQIGAKD